MTAERADSALPSSPCTVCASPQPRLRFVSFRGPVTQCPACHTFRVLDSNRPVDQQALFYSTIDEEKYTAYFRPFRKAQYHEILGNLKVPAGSSLLDVGASYGWMVEEALGLGFDAYGLEPGSAAVKKEIEGRMFRGTLADYAQTMPRQFDVVTIWHVLEHLPDPLQAIADMSSLVRPGGRLVVAVPTCEGRMFRLGLWFNDVFGSSRLLDELFYFHNPNMHYYYYAESGVKLLLEQFGFRIVDTRLLEAFDWNQVHLRGTNSLTRLGLRLLGPLVAASGFTSIENLVVVGERRP